MDGLRVFAAPGSTLGPAERREILCLCAAAFGASFDALFDLTGPEAVHILGRLDDGTLASHAVITKRHFIINGRLSLRAAYIDAAATRPGMQGAGRASKIMRAALAYAKPRFDIAGLSTFIPAFYGRFGFKPWEGPLGLLRDGEAIMTGDVEGVVMANVLKDGLPLTFKEELVAGWRPGGGW